MPVVKVRTGVHYRREEGKLIRYGVGDRLEVSAKEMESCGDKFTVIGDGAEVRPKKDAGRVQHSTEGAPGEFDLETADLDALKAKAKELDIDIGPRWGERRIRDAIAEVLEEVED